MYTEKQMIGAILGDIIGSVFEFELTKPKDFPLFSGENQITDDGILTIAIFKALEKSQPDFKNLSNVTANQLVQAVYYYPFPMGGYGASFFRWAQNCLTTNKIQAPYNSFGNGAAMRVSPVAYFANTLEECIELSDKVTKITHNHPEGIKGAQAVSVAIFLALQNKTKQEIFDHITKHYYPLNQTLDQIRETYHFDGTCQGSVPQSLQSFFEANSYEETVRNAISLGGDTDTMAAIAGSIAEAYYKIPTELEEKVFDYLDENMTQSVLKMIEKRNEALKNKLNI